MHAMLNVNQAGNISVPVVHAPDSFRTIHWTEIMNIYQHNCKLTLTESTTSNPQTGAKPYKQTMTNNSFIMQGDCLNCYPTHTTNNMQLPTTWSTTGFERVWHHF